MALNTDIQARINAIVAEEFEQIATSRVRATATDVTAYVTVDNGDYVYGDPVIGDHSLGQFSRDLDRKHASPVLVIGARGRINGKDFDSGSSYALWVTGFQVHVGGTVDLSAAGGSIMHRLGVAIRDRVTADQDILDALWAEHLRDFERRAEEKITYLRQLVIRSAHQRGGLPYGTHLLASS
jgi:hypothetical protein